MRYLIFLIVTVFSLSIAIAQAQNSIWFDALKSGDLETVKSLIESGTDVNARDGEGSTPLIWASRYGHPQIVELLIAKGAFVDVREFAQPL